MDHINNLKAKEFGVLLHYHFESENLKGSPNEVELVEAITDFFRNYREGLAQRRCGCVYVCVCVLAHVCIVTNKAVHGAGEDMVKISIFLF